MSGMASESGLTELRRGVLGPCVLALLELRPRFGLELVRELSAADGLLTSDGTVYPLLNRLRDAGLVTSEWRDNEGERARRYYSITPGRAADPGRHSGPTGTSSPRPSGSAQPHPAARARRARPRFSLRCRRDGSWYEGTPR